MKIESREQASRVYYAIISGFRFTFAQYALADTL
jgi:hypothetical protein